MMLHDETSTLKIFDFMNLLPYYFYYKGVQPISLKDNHLKSQRIIEQLSYFQTLEMREYRVFHYGIILPHAATALSQEICNWTIDQIWNLRLDFSFKNMIAYMFKPTISLQSVTVLVNAIVAHPFDLDVGDPSIFDKMTLADIGTIDIVPKLEQIDSIIDDITFYRNFLSFLLRNNPPPIFNHVIEWLRRKV
jgi:hypothetical protein